MNTLLTISLTVEFVLYLSITILTTLAFYIVERVRKYKQLENDLRDLHYEFTPEPPDGQMFIPHMGNVPVYRTFKFGRGYVNSQYRPRIVGQNGMSGQDGIMMIL